MRLGLVRRGFSATGGAEAYLQRFAQAAAEAGHTLVLFSERWPASAWPYARVEIASRTPRGFADALAARQPRRECDFVFSLERVWSCDLYRAGDGVHAAWLERRANFEPSWKSWCRHFSGKHRELLELERALFSDSGARFVIANSTLVEKEITRFFSYPPTRLKVVPNGLPDLAFDFSARASTRARLGLADGELALLFVGSGWARKGLRFAAHALAQLPPDLRRKTTLLVAGRGNPGSLARMPGVRFLGAKENIPALLAASDIFILPTIYEPFSNACLEALSAGLPVLTTSANGFSEIIESGRQGEIVDDPRDLAEWAAAISRWADPFRRASVRAALRLHAAPFSIAENVRRTWEVIERLA